jgi:hypothetical protein
MVDIAAQQRHVMLLKKVRNSQPLTAAELSELERYESMAKARKKAQTPDAATADKAPDDTRAAFLAQLEELAGAPGISEAQAADRLGYAPAAFAALLAKDAEAGRVWRHAKTDALVRAGRILWKLADDGNTAAARQILESLRETLAASDLSAMPMKAVADLLGEKPQRLDFWYRKHGMPRNADGSIDLKRFLEWFQRRLAEEYRFDVHRLKGVDVERLLGISRFTRVEWQKAGLPRNADGTYNLTEVFDWRLKQVGTRPAGTATALNPMHARKAELLQIEIDTSRRRLVERAAVEMGFVARAGAIVNVIDRKGGELPMQLANLSAENLKPILDEFFMSLRQAAAAIPEDVSAVLPPERQAALAAFAADLVKEHDD